MRTDYRSVEPTSVTALLAWGVLTFGAVYPWGYVPLLLAAAVLGAVGVARFGSGDPRMAVAAALVPAAVLLQVVSIPKSWLGWISPGGDAALRRENPAYNVFDDWHALSIDPGETISATVFIAVLVLFGLGLRSALAADGGDRVATAIGRNIVIVGTLVALVGLIQSATFNGKLYWFWTPMGRTTGAFGPFVNHNHFAGWMLLALFLGAGYFASILASIPFARLTDVRRKVLWLSSPDAGRLVCSAAGLLTMSIALAWTLSRSGIIGFAVGAAVFLAVGLTRRQNRAALSAASVFAVCLTGLAWRGSSDLASLYSRTGTLEWRLALWKDSIPALKSFWLSGSGLNTYERLMQSYPLSDPSLNPINAHNDYLQLGIEGGLLVGIPVLVLIVIVLYEIRCRFRERQTPQIYWIRVGAMAGLAAMAVQEFSDFSLHVPGVAILFAAVLAVVVHRPIALSEHPVPRPVAPPARTFRLV